MLSRLSPWTSALLAGILLLHASCTRPSQPETLPPPTAVSATKTAPAPSKTETTSTRFQAVTDLFEDLVERRQLAGGVVLVALDHEIVLEEGIGYRDLASQDPMTPDTLFRICSMTKPITSVATMIGIEKDQFRLFQPVSDFFPEFGELRVAKPLPDGVRIQYHAVRKPVTIRHLLTHTSGLTYRFWGKEPQTSRMEQLGVTDGLVEHPLPQRENVRKLADVPLLFQPGSAWEYGLNTDVLGALLEYVYGQSLEMFFQREIFDPLGMDDTHFRVPAEKLGRLATVYQPGEEDTVVEPLPAGPVRRGHAIYSSSYPHAQEGSYYSGGAGLTSTARDYWKFLDLLLRGGTTADGKKILDEVTVKAMLRNQCRGKKLTIESHGDGFGFGFGVVTEAARDRGLGSVGSFSWGGFYHTYFWVDPERKLVGIYMTQLYPWDHLGLPAKFREAVYRSLDS